MRNAVRAVGVAGLAVVPLLGGAAGVSAAEGASPAPGGSPSPAVRLEYHVAQNLALEAGEDISFSLDGMPPEWDKVEVTSPALQEPITLTPLKKGSTQSVQVDAPGTDHRVRSGLRAGTYPVTATSHGRTVATAQLKVLAENTAQIYRFVIGPRNASPGSGTPASLRPGSDVRVVLTDLRAAPGEDSLTVTSPIFKGSLTIKTDSPDNPGCKCDDPGTVYAGHGELRGDVPNGRYTVAVVSHHGQQTTKQHVTIAGQPVADGGDPSWAVTGGVAATGLALASGRAFAVRRRRSRKAAPSA
ncbi:hypothetical protein [Streptomyces fodineus]|uniref:hypothetical protein n=1 Tax=Streptomyces fodineus TaxID=1904616 RepID=UPI001D054F55|nr:hypothetical protein [Streptomyces fodineus]